MIAAGEIIDRPASIVKELVENAIDAESDAIEVHLLHYGKDEIKVIDNGCGMGRHDALLAFERHATSKIREPEDLHNIHTLGFRGEALPSISSVARLVLITREKGTEIGTQVILDGGKLIKVSEIGAALGTTVQISSLFKNIPARLKFMKSNSVEFSHITQVLDQEALAHYTICFTLKHNGKTVRHMPAVKTLSERVQQLYGHEITDHLIEIDGEFKTLGIQGLMGEATYTKPNRYSQYTYVNNRFVRNQILLKAVCEGYGHVLPRDRYPVCFLFLNIPPGEVDVNVHPAKIEVRFSNQQEIFEGIAKIIQNRLATSQAAVARVMLTASTPVAEPEPIAEPEPCEFIRQHEFIKPHSFPPPDTGRLARGTQNSLFLKGDLGGFLEKREIQIPPSPPLEKGGVKKTTPVSFPPLPPAAADADSSQPVQADSGQPVQADLSQPVQADSGQSEVRIDKDPRLLFTPEGDLIQINNSYILFETRQGLVIVDQHAAHERVRYEQLQQEYRAKTLHSQRLLVPITFRIPGHAAEPAEELLSQLRLAGFDLEHFGHDTFVIKATPLLLAKTDPREIIQGIFDDFSESSKRDSQSIFDTLLMRMACSSAIKANHRLNKEEMKSLIDQLRETSMPFRCPHGRPTTIQLDLRLLEKHFLRI